MAVTKLLGVVSLGYIKVRVDSIKNIGIFFKTDEQVGVNQIIAIF